MLGVVHGNDAKNEFGVGWLSKDDLNVYPSILVHSV